MSAIDITKVLRPELTVIDEVEITCKEDVFAIMSKKFAEAGVASSAEEFEKALYKREEEGSTYMGGLGVPLAIPHGISDAINTSSVGFMRVKTPFIYKSKGEEGEVKYMFILGIKGGENGSLAIISALARLLIHPEFTEKLDTVQTYEELIEAVKAAQGVLE